MNDVEASGPPPVFAVFPTHHPHFPFLPFAALYQEEKITDADVLSIWCAFHEQEMRQSIPVPMRVHATRYVFDGLRHFGFLKGMRKELETLQHTEFCMNTGNGALLLFFPYNIRIEACFVFLCDNITNRLMSKLLVGSNISAEGSGFHGLTFMIRAIAEFVKCNSDPNWGKKAEHLYGPFWKEAVLIKLYTRGVIGFYKEDKVKSIQK